MPIEIHPSAVNRVYGHITTTVHPKDRLYAVSRTASKIAALPPKINQLPWMSPAKDQGNLGTCTAFAATTLREYLSKRFVGSAISLSPLFLYFVERTIEGDVATDSGASIRTAMGALHNVGVCPDVENPYVEPNFAKTPIFQNYVNARKFITGTYRRLMTLVDMKNTLNSGFVFELGFQVYESFQSNAIATNGILTMPTSSEQQLGGHAVCCFGYDDTFTFPGTSMKGALLLRNSWGANWGASGNFYMPYAYITPYVSDCWMAHLGTSWH